MLNELTHSDFEDLEDKSFEIDFGEAGRLTATLEKTARFDLEPEEGKREPFSIFLRCPAPPVQRTYPATNSKLGTLELFLVPIDENEDGILFEAVFT
ncbi:MAG: hypothetical protein ACE5GX_00190 [Thermoanaerobaculia bacterium]